MSSKTILHVIDSLGKGGAEMLLKNTVNLLTDYRHKVVFLNEPRTLENDFEGEVEFVCLEHRGWKDLLRSAGRLRKIIKQIKPVLIHSHLFESNICARLAKPRNFRLLNSLHSVYSIDAFSRNRKSLWLEKLTLRKEHVLIAVSDYVLKDYVRLVPFKGSSYILYNFLPDSNFQFEQRQDSASGLKCVAIGNLKAAKNYHYLLDIFKKLDPTCFSLDIYGTGTMQQELQMRIDHENLPVRLCGQIDEVNPVLKNYDLFIQASDHEGFGLSVIEAMVTGLPVLISDIPVFREISAGNAHFFTLHNSDQAAEIMNALEKDKELRQKHVNEAYNYCLNYYSQEVYREKLVGIYESEAKNLVISETGDFSKSNI